MNNMNYPSADIDKVLLAISAQTENVNSMLGVVKGISDRVDSIDKNFNDYKKQSDRRFDQLENREEITYEQQTIIDNLISQVVYSRIGVGDKPSKWTIEERVINNKYGKLFRRRLRKEVANKGHLAYPYRTTQKGNFLDACKDIEAWYPRNGIDELKREADDNAIAKKIAQEQGYE